VNGSGQLISVMINPEVVDPKDVEMLEDLVTSAVHEAQQKAAESSKQKYLPLTGGLNIPGLF
ncbi:MAG: YbaB/EbfC family nucleoid-associated protein, partial [Chloroflexi bacterium]|nr:YbaB/EbfC family nucleoid-associated protein [Chloroflexota bacterium]